MKNIEYTKIIEPFSNEELLSRYNRLDERGKAALSYMLEGLNLLDLEESCNMEIMSYQKVQEGFK